MKMKAHHFKTINYVLFIAQELHKLVSDRMQYFFILSQLKQYHVYQYVCSVL